MFSRVRHRFDEFQAWYSAESGTGDASPYPESTDSAGEANEGLVTLKGLLNLGQYSVADVASKFAAVADDKVRGCLVVWDPLSNSMTSVIRIAFVPFFWQGQLSRAAFNRVFASLVPLSGDMSLTQRGQRQQALGMLFDLFDRDGNGLVDIQELLSGLSVLCGGERDDKIRAAFELFGKPACLSIWLFATDCQLSTVHHCMDF